MARVLWPMILIALELVNVCPDDVFKLIQLICVCVTVCFTGIDGVSACNHCVVSMGENTV